MIIKSVKLVNFRNHENYILNCKKKTSLIIGENGSGKTSILEAIYETMRGKSFRAMDREILKRKTEFYRVELEYTSGEKIITVYDGKKKTFLTDDKKSARLAKNKKYPVVLFLPSDLHLIDTSPTKKRDYFDRILADFDDSYNNSLLRYNKALRQRNELLKKDFFQLDDFFSWNIMLAKYGLEVRKKRKEFIDKINLNLTKTYRSIADNKDEIKLDYEFYGGELNESEYLDKLEKNIERDKILGHTGFGVHRDNYEFYFNKVVASGSASRGEVRSILLAMKFIEADLIEENIGLKPVVLLDDVFSELDEKRQKCLVKNFKNNQVIITSVEVVG